jgi:DNA polymerase sigma
MQKGHEDLSDDQIDRQDAVDNVIFELIQSIHPSTSGIDWNIEMIADIRNCLKEWVVDHYGLCTEQSFYPYMKK